MSGAGLPCVSWRPPPPMTAGTGQSHSLTHTVVTRFRATSTGPPTWAWPFHPPVPMVGGVYRPGTGLLVYAGAENLSWLNKADPPPRFTTEQAWDRYRVWYEEV